jgi:antitoxin component of MazEF toxin-antitoxin module
MRLQKHFARKVGNKEYSKYVVVIPPESIEKLEWEEGQELEPQVKGRSLVISPKVENNED